MSPRHHYTDSHHLLAAALLSMLVFLACGSGSSPTDPGDGGDPDPGRVVEPACEDPAPLEGEHDPAAPGYIVQFHDGVDAHATAAELAEKYGFTVDTVYDAALLGFFTPDATPEMVAGLRCEESVELVEHNGGVEAF